MKKKLVISPYSGLMKMLLIMKVISILLFVSALSLSAETYSQVAKLSLKLEKASVKDVFDAIENQSEYIFFYQDQNIDLNKQVDINVKNKKINDVLDELFEGTNNTYKINDRQIIINIDNTKLVVPNKGEIKQQRETPAEQQKKTVSGNVIDEKGIPVPGVSIVAKGTTIGVTSDIDGNYMLEIPENAKVLVFSFVGLKTAEEQINGRVNINVTMAQVLQDVDEVMVIAYGTTKKESFTGSAAVLEDSKITKTQAIDIAESIQGNVSGIEISQASGSPRAPVQMRIRGVGSINASSEPLVVVDGMPYGNSLTTINAHDIEDISVLKDAAATALYGSRAANGVVMVTTKKGKKDESTVEFIAQWGITSRAMPTYETVGAEKYYELEWEALKNMYESFGIPNPAQQASSNIVGTLVYNPFSIDEPVGTDGKIKSNARLLWDTDWSDAYYNKGQKQEYALNFRGGNEKGQYFMSLGYLDVEGVLVNSDYRRFSARLDNQRQVFDWLKVGMNLSGSSTKSNEPISENGFFSIGYHASSLAAIFPIYMRDAQGNIINDAQGNPLYDFGLSGDEDGRGSRPGWWTNPGTNYLGSEQYDKSNQTNDQASLRTFLDLKLTKGLTFKSSLSYDFSSIGTHQFWNSQYGSKAYKGGEANKTEQKQKAWTINNILNYTKSFDKHNLAILLGHEWYKLNSSYLYAGKSNFSYPNLNELDAGSVIESAGSYNDNYSLESILSRLNYDYDDRYYLSLSYRTDGSSRFHEDVRWGNFWSIGGSWRITQEEFMTSSKNWLSNLKLKASYGTLGNDNLGTYYAYQQLYETGYNNYGQSGVQISRLGTPTLTWEVSKSSNVGLEIGLFDGINIELELFKRNVEDMLFAKPLPLSAGITSVDENIGDMENKGFEFNIFATILRKKDFVWNFEFNTTHYKNKITQLMQDEILTGSYQYKVGNSAYDFYLKEYAGVDYETGDPLFYTDPKDAENRGTVNNWFHPDAAKFNQGTALPDYYGGFTNQFIYKGFELSVLYNYKVGGQIMDNEYLFLTHTGAFGGWNMHKDVLNHWTPENRETEVPRMNAGDYSASTTSTRGLFDASYLRLRNISLSYNLPPSLCNKAYMKDCRIALIGQNLFTISHSKGVDPEVGFGNTNTYKYPQTKVVSLALNITL